MRNLTAKMTYREAWKRVRALGGQIKQVQNWIDTHQSIAVPDFLEDDHADVLARGIAMLKRHKRDIAKAEKILDRYRTKWLDNEMVALDKRFRKALMRGQMEVLFERESKLTSQGAERAYWVGPSSEAKVGVSFEVQEDGTKTVRAGWTEEKGYYGQGTDWRHTQKGGRWPFTKIVQEIGKIIRKAQAPITASMGDLFEVQTNDTYAKYFSGTPAEVRAGDILQFLEVGEDYWGEFGVFNRLHPDGRVIGKPVKIRSKAIRFQMKPVDHSALIIPGGADAQGPRPDLARTIWETYPNLEGWLVNAQGDEVWLSHHKKMPEVGQGRNSVAVYLNASPNSSGNGTLDFTLFIEKGGKTEVIESKTLKVKWSGDDATDARLWGRFTAGIINKWRWNTWAYDKALKEMGHPVRKASDLRQGALKRASELPVGHPTRKKILAVLDEKTAYSDKFGLRFDFTRGFSFTTVPIDPPYNQTYSGWILMKKSGYAKAYRAAMDYIRKNRSKIERMTKSNDVLDAINDHARQVAGKAPYWHRYLMPD